MAALALVARRWLRRLERFAEESNELLLVIAVGLGGFYLSVRVILALTSTPAMIDDVGRFGPAGIECGSGLRDAGLPSLPRDP
jgi:hypothetical protein